MTRSMVAVVAMLCVGCASTYKGKLPSQDPDTPREQYRINVSSITGRGELAGMGYDLESLEPVMRDVSLDAYEGARRARGWQSFGHGLIWLGAGAFVPARILVGSNDVDTARVAETWQYVGIGTAAVGLVVSFVAGRARASAISDYNSALQRPDRTADTTP